LHIHEICIVVFGSENSTSGYNFRVKYKFISGAQPRVGSNKGSLMALIKVFGNSAHKASPAKALAFQKNLNLYAHLVRHISPRKIFYRINPIYRLQKYSSSTFLFYAGQ